MNIYIWADLSGITHNYHSGGGVAVIAETREQACRLLHKHAEREVIQGPSEWSDDEQKWQEVLLEDTAPTFSASIDASEEQVFIFPDAGCC